MRISELFEDSHSQRIESDLNTILMTAKAEGQTEISTKVLVKRLLGMGYSVSTESLMGILQGNPLVQSATTQTVGLNEPDHAGVSGGPDEKAQNAEKVSSMAQDAAKKDIGM